MGTQGNGILKVLSLMALKIRYPGITSGKPCRLGRCKQANDLRPPGPRGYTFCLFDCLSNSKPTPKLWKFDFDDTLERVRRKVSTELVDGDKGINVLHGEDDWSDWKSDMKKMVAHNYYECAMFL